MPGSNTDRTGKRCPLSTRGRGFDGGRRSNINPARRRRDAVLQQRKRGPRPGLDMVVPAHKRLLADHDELNASLDRILGDDPEQ